MLYQSPSGNTLLYCTPKYQYEVETYIIYPKRMELYESKTITRKTPFKQKYATQYTHHIGYTVLTVLEWYGAPKKFLKENGFVPFDEEEYKATIKENRKKKKL